MQKNCKKLPNNINKWKIEWTYLCFLPIPYKIEPIVYEMPPATSKIIPGVGTDCNSKSSLNIMHQPISK